MTLSRLEQLFEFLRQDPHDPFTMYALALEYTNSDVSQALVYFEKLLNEHPDYVATYYHAAKLYADLGRHTDAERVFKKGMTIATNARKPHAFNELQRAYRAFLDEDD